MSHADILETLEPPVLVISSAAGRGMHSIGEAIRRSHAGSPPIRHLVIEELLPPRAAAEDLHRYRRICDRFPALLWLVYTVPFVYRRKYDREIRGRGSDLRLLRDAISRTDARTVVAISHRAAFWVSVLKHRESLGVGLWALEAEYGPSLGWQYLCWEEVDGFLSPRRPEHHTYPLAPRTIVRQVPIPVAGEFRTLADDAGDRNEVLLTGGSWGLGPLLAVARELARATPRLGMSIVCGDNQRLQRRLQSVLGSRPNVRIAGTLDSLAPLMARAGSVVCKPGISTIAEAHAAGRQLFLLRGLPVAEDHNARYAIEHFGARRYSLGEFLRWHETG